MPNSTVWALGDVFGESYVSYTPGLIGTWKSLLYDVEGDYILKKEDPILSRIKKIEARHTTKEPLTPSNWYLDDDEDWDEDYEEDEDDY